MPTAEPPKGPLAPGTPAPEFTLPAGPDKKLSLSDYRGKLVVLAFYPADWSPVCTDQMSVFNEAIEEFQRLGADVLGVSVDGIWCCAALLHVPLDRTRAALDEMRRILRPGGWLALVTAAGQGARLEPVPYAPRTRRWFFYRGPGQLHEQLHDAGLQVTAMTEEPTSRHWLKFLAHAA